MPIEIEVQVLPEDVDPESSGRSSSCPVARALQRATGDRSIRVYSRYVNHNIPGRSNWEEGGRVPLPHPIRKLIKHFDKTGEFPPTTFTIHLPKNWIKKGEDHADQD